MENKSQRRIDFAGKTFGNWTALKPVEVSSGAAHWQCVCNSCGTEQCINPKQLLCHSTIVPICDECIKAADNTLEKKVYQKAKNRIAQEQMLSARNERQRNIEEGYLIPQDRWYSILYGAKKRGIAVTITKEDALAVFRKQNCCCALTGMKLSMYDASLDRIDNDRGYEIDNVQWVHKDINIMKHVHSQDYFIRMCVAVSCHSLGIRNFEAMSEDELSKVRRLLQYIANDNEEAKAA